MQHLILKIQFKFLLNEIKKTGIELIDVQTKQSNLEQIFVEILKND